MLEHLRPEPGHTFLDCGAGMGGPAAFAARETGVRPLLTEPEQRACRAVRYLFGLPALQAGSQLPIATGAIAIGWSLGVLSTVDDQAAYLAELRRVLAPQARFGLIVYCVTRPEDLRLEPPQGNTFPTAETLDELPDQATLRVLASGWTDHFAALPADWQNAMATVQVELEHRHRDDARWQAAEEQSNRLGSMLTDQRGHVGQPAF